jgi:flagellar protein FliO/FliZ
METVFLALRVVVALAAVLGLIWVVQRRLTRGAGTPKGSLATRLAPKRAIQVLGTHRLAPKASITVVEIDGVRLVLGVTEHGITVLDPTPQTPVTAPAAPIAAPEAIAPESDLTPVAASAVESRATADAGEAAPADLPAPDFAAALRDALEEVAEAPVLSTVVAPANEPVEHVAPRRRRRVTIPALAEQLLPHMTRTLAGAIGMRVDAKPGRPIEPAGASSAPFGEATPAASGPPRLPRTTVSGALDAFLRNAAPVEALAHQPALTRDYSKAEPLVAHLPVLQRAS